MGREVELPPPFFHDTPVLPLEIPMTAPLSAEQYRAKLWKNKRGGSYFTLVDCPACNLEFRLLWPAAVLTYPERQTLYMKCPGCRHSFTSLDVKIGKLVFVAAGCENFPAAPVVSNLVA
jgi:ribosomal protein S27E